ncbi:MAG: symmetrical bis(5'-nucleosyl)-tetraphosphatase [Methylotenera sp.]|nr:symmetrical bis(5'-nucleosyl)-tetraphosphatase [Methylotenera sp.]
MTTYAIGDIQGCYYAFQALLERIQFNQKKDQLWLVGDLINRGSGSLEVLRWCYQHQNSLSVVLGNHDLHALVVAEGIVSAHKGDTLDALLAAHDCDILLHWLRHQPLAYQSEKFLMVHAGFLPQWNANQAIAYAKEVEAALQSSNYLHFLTHMYGNVPIAWHEDLTGIDRLRMITNAMTRLRICTAQGEMEFKFKGELADIPKGYMPWFDVPNRATQSNNVIFGHWSALGLQQRKHVFALDTGCLWGGKLTAMNVHTLAIVQVDSHPLDKPVKLKK